MLELLAQRRADDGVPRPQFAPLAVPEVGALEEAGVQEQEQGLEQGRISAVLNMLKEKLPLEMIARVSEMSLEKIREIGQMHHLL